MLKFEHIISTDGQGLWSRQVKYVKCRELVVIPCGDTFGELRVYFDPKTWDIMQHGLIYTDPSFLRDLKGLLYDMGLNTNVCYSEQGMQGNNYVSLDVSKDFLDSWRAYVNR